MQLILAFNKQHIFKYVLRPGTQVTRKSSYSSKCACAYTQHRTLILNLKMCCRYYMLFRDPPAKNFLAEEISVRLLKYCRAFSHLYIDTYINTHTSITISSHRQTYINASVLSTLVTIS